MHPSQDFDLEQDPPPLSADLAQDLELGTLLSVMAGGDEFLFDVAQRQADGERTFRISPGTPLPTSHGGDVYRHIFAADLQSAAQGSG